MKVKDKATTKVVDYIKKSIKDGSWKIGTKIPSENQICKTLNVSRTSVRSGLEPFIVMAIIVSHQGKGKYVVSTDFSRFGDGRNHLIQNASDVMEALESRKIIEPAICRQVAPIISEECLQKLRDILSDMVAAIGNSKEFVKHDMKFHQTICEEVGNHILLSIMQPIFTDDDQLQIQLNKAIGYYGGLYYHTLIIDALAKHDEKLAASMMREHLQKGIDDLEGTFDNSDE